MTSIVLKREPKQPREVGDHKYPPKLHTLIVPRSTDMDPKQYGKLDKVKQVFPDVDEIAELKDIQPSLEAMYGLSHGERACITMEAINTAHQKKSTLPINEEEANELMASSLSKKRKKAKAEISDKPKPEKRKSPSRKKRQKVVRYERKAFEGICDEPEPEKQKDESVVHDEWTVSATGDDEADEDKEEAEKDIKCSLQGDDQVAVSDSQNDEDDGDYHDDLDERPLFQKASTGGRKRKADSPESAARRKAIQKSLKEFEEKERDSAPQRADIEFYVGLFLESEDESLCKRFREICPPSHINRLVSTASELLSADFKYVPTSKRRLDQMNTKSLTQTCLYHYLRLHKMVPTALTPCKKGKKAGTDLPGAIRALFFKPEFWIKADVPNPVPNKKT